MSDRAPHRAESDDSDVEVRHLSRWLSSLPIFG
jgi:hypothetical protein